MIDIRAFATRVRRRAAAAACLFFGGAFMLLVDFTTNFPTRGKGEFAALWLFSVALGAFFYYLSLELPRAEIMQIAQERGGLVTEGELATALGAGPEVVRRTLAYLQRLGIASPQWTELRRNLWEFPDYVKLPMREAVTLAKTKGGCVTIADLLAQGHSLDVAEETLETLTQKGLGRTEGAGQARSVVLEGG
jgi:hypothetical protein